MLVFKLNKNFIFLLKIFNNKTLAFFITLILIPVKNVFSFS